MTVLEYPYTYPEDGGFSGFLSAVFEAFTLKQERPRFRCPTAGGRMLELFDEPVPVTFSAGRAQRVAEGIRRQGGAEVWKALVRAFLSDAGGKEEFIFAFIRRLMNGGGPEILNRLDLPETAAVCRASGRTANEAHKFLGILRFVKYSHLYYAPIEPDCRVLPLLAGHFSTRFADQEWVIHDVRRAEALFWNRGKLSFETGVTAEAPEDEDDFFEHLWKAYFTAAAIEERRNLALQRNFVPLKYRSCMTEMG